ncbi:MAG: hypothetical protein ACLFSY_05545 [Desulfonatronovibrionaceae bacterium]
MQKSISDLPPAAWAFAAFLVLFLAPGLCFAELLRIDIEYARLPGPD